MKIPVCLLGALICLVTHSLGQVDSSAYKLSQFPNKVFSRINAKTANLDEALTKQTQKYLARMARKEQKIQQRLFKLDSNAAKSLFAGTQTKYTSLQNSMASGTKTAAAPLTVKGKDGMNYFFRVRDLGNYMKATYGAPDISGTNKSLYSGQHGIIEFNVSGWSDATGHFTTWDGDSVGHGDYFNPTPPVKLTNAHLWIFP